MGFNKKKNKSSQWRKDNKEIGAIWKRVSKAGKKFYSGQFNGPLEIVLDEGDKMRFVMFKNTYKQEGDTTPNFRLYESKDSEEYSGKKRGRKKNPVKHNKHEKEDDEEDDELEEKEDNEEDDEEKEDSDDEDEDTDKATDDEDDDTDEDDDEEEEKPRGKKGLNRKKGKKSKDDDDDEDEDDDS